jgi:histidine triad (HIT) family protein
MSSIFSKIVKGEIPCYKVAENDQFLAFLDSMPLKKGHVLVIPKVEVDFIFDMEDNLLGEMMIFSKEVAHKMKRILPCKKIGVTVIGLEVPHAHIHLIPIDSVTDMDFSKQKLSLTAEEQTQLAKQLLEA